ncbi:rhodanese-like domain-containing protein [Altererythrobacter xixiisoli]|uniref:Rhodanese-like domain-containing protein n=1 Tax=Croceibacterium xixiisoli TaxID=1476466 RepID=A0A6I4TVX7_9SPHN|nr:rhodanese-like domain-containing protein [Croceibacterium xixiisoli]MXO99271.1 rhodanese-like domain-containing protein [Croceibacterium xixiisoli]
MRLAMITSLALPLLIAGSALAQSPAAQGPTRLTTPIQTTPEQRNPQIDYPGFQQLTREIAPVRSQRLLPMTDFQAVAGQPDVLVLDARSRDAFVAGHLAGAVNLPLTDFNEESLAAVIGTDRGRKILIYCNNNFSNNAAPVPRKAAPLALNIQTFINLTGYGYPNVWELADVVDFNDPAVGWVTG